MTHYVQIQDRAKQAIVSWEPWAHLVELLDCLSKQKLILMFKSRQIGASWTIAGYAVWLCTFFESTKVLELSQGEEEAWDLLDKSRFIANHHPDFLRLKLSPDQRGQLGFPATNGQIKALPSTENAGRSTDATLVVPDEWEYHPYAEANFAALKPTIDAGGQFVGISTVNKLKMDTFPKSVWRKAKAGENNFHPLFYPWNVVPTRNQEWFDSVTRDLDGWQREQEYPCNEEEALSPAKAACRFDIEALKAMLDECHNPIREEYNGEVKIYKEPVAGRRYCFAIDPSEGNYDPAAGIIMDWQTCEEVAEYHGKIPIDEQARIIYDLYERYNDAYCAPERNASGLSLIDKLKDMGLKKMHLTKKDKEGWWTSSANRPVMLAELAEAIRLRDLRIPNREAISEFLSFIRTEKHPDGKAVGGAHDDYVMAWAIGYQMRKSMPMGAGVVKSVKYKERW